jgi:hypothetical protein
MTELKIPTAERGVNNLGSVQKKPLGKAEIRFTHVMAML